MSAVDFNNWFNKTFEKVKVHDNELDEGYGAWLKSNEGISEEKNISISQFDNEFESQKKKMQSNALQVLFCIDDHCKMEYLQKLSSA